MNWVTAKLALVVLCILSIVGSIVFSKKLFAPDVYYPYTEIGAPEGIRLHLLQKGQRESSQCARSLASQTSAITGNCSTCPVRVSACLLGLDETKKKWLTEAPLDSPSARMP